MLSTRLILDPTVQRLSSFLYEVGVEQLLPGGGPQAACACLLWPWPPCGHSCRS